MPDKEGGKEKRFRTKKRQRDRRRRFLNRAESPPPPPCLDGVFDLADLAATALTRVFSALPIGRVSVDFLS